VVNRTVVTSAAVTADVFAATVADQRIPDRSCKNSLSISRGGENKLAIDIDAIAQYNQVGLHERANTIPDFVAEGQEVAKKALTN
jgi:hypothetical protein